MSYKIKITRLDSSHKNLRTDEVVGTVEELPTVGNSLDLVGKSLTPGPGMTFRLVTTSIIQKVEEDKFFTENSTYAWELLNDDDK